LKLYLPHKANGTQVYLYTKITSNDYYLRKRIVKNKKEHKLEKKIKNSNHKKDIVFFTPRA
jgi:hypothetical protein